MAKKTDRHDTTLSRQNRVSVPRDICQRLGIQPGSQLIWRVVDGGVQLIPVEFGAKSGATSAAGMANSRHAEI